MFPFIVTFLCIQEICVCVCCFELGTSLARLYDTEMNSLRMKRKNFYLQWSSLCGRSVWLSTHTSRRVTTSNWGFCVRVLTPSTNTIFSNKVFTKRRNRNQIYVSSKCKRIYCKVGHNSEIDKNFWKSWDFDRRKDVCEPKVFNSNFV